MKAASSKEIKSALTEQSSTQLIELCLRLARFKKENKELLTYLLFEEQDEDAYIHSAKKVIDEGFQTATLINGKGSRALKHAIRATGAAAKSAPAARYVALTRVPPNLHRGSRRITPTSEAKVPSRCASTSTSGVSAVGPEAGTSECTTGGV